MTRVAYKHKNDPCYGILTAYAERFNVNRRAVMSIGTLQLCLCRSDEARRLLIYGLNPQRRPGPYVPDKRIKTVTPASS